MAATSVYTEHRIDPDQEADGTYTFSGVSLGTAAAGRIIVVYAFFRSAVGTPRTLSSMTIGGNAADIASGPTASATNGTSSISGATGILQVDAGETADIVVDWSGLGSPCGIEVYAIYDADSATPHDILGDNTLGAPTGTIDVPAGGTCCAAAWSRDVSTTGASWAWTGLTEDHDEIVVVNSAVISAASDDFATLQTGLTVTATYTGGGTFQIMLAVSFGPAAGGAGTLASKLALLGVGV